MLCDYCKIRKAYFTLKNGKHCCEKYWQRCPKYVEQKQIVMKEIMNRPESKERIRKLRKGVKDSKETKEKKRIALLGNTHKKGKKESKKTRERKSIAKTYTVYDYKKKHPLLLKVEELKENPKTGKIMGHCKNHNCKNSKEKGGWFILKPRQIEARLRGIYYLNDGLYFYCSEKCKKECILYNLMSDPLKDFESPFTNEEIGVLRQHVLERDNYKCVYCGKIAEHAHHERPVKLEPFFALDPDLCWSVCKECHYEKAHKKGSECSIGNLSKIICKPKKK